MLAAQLRDLRTVIHEVGLYNKPLMLWGDSFARSNPADAKVAVPHEIKQPAHAEPLGGLVVLLAALYEDDIKAVYVCGGLSSYQSLLGSQFLHVPHDALVPGILTVGDLPDLVSLLSPRPVRLDGFVDGLNRRVSEKALGALYGEKADVHAEPATDAELVRWFVDKTGG